MKPELREIDRIISEALNEDLGVGGDITSRITIPENAQAKFNISARDPLVACGLFITQRVFDYFKPNVKITLNVEEGQNVNKNTSLISGEGSALAILSAERVALNLLRQTCGVATGTRDFVELTKDSKAKILDTRKTIPGLRALQKYAVTIGGGYNHRFRLDDGILIKDNHISVCGSVTEAINKARKNSPSLTKIEVECDTLEQVKEAKAAGADIIMLDNMSLEMLNKAVEIVAGEIPLEASGNVNLDTVKEISKTGVDYISAGIITNAPKYVDIGLDIEL